MLTKNYRMGEYKIIESDSGELTWETHGGFGALQQGRCFRKGQILFMEPAEIDAPGFLKREFLEHLKKLSVWSKTKYYCNGVQIHHCTTNTTVTKKEMVLWGLKEGIKQTQVAYSGENREAIYRLLGYEITVKADGQMIWKKPAGPLTINQGTCAVSEDILFIGPSHDVETDVSRQRFVSDLKKLPIWDRTTYYSTKTWLCTCNPETSEQKEQKGWRRTRRKMGKHLPGKHPKKHMDLKPKDSRLWVSGAALFSSWAKKSILYAVDSILLIISHTLSYLISWCKALKKKLYHREENRHPL
jgi:hypothetical protein